MNKRIVIIGGGAAAMACALKLVNDFKEIYIIEQEKSLGGVLNQCIHRGFGIEYFKQDLTGPEFAQLLITKITDSHIKVLLNSHVINVSKNKQVTYLDLNGKQVIDADVIVFAVGSMENSAATINLAGKRLPGIFTAGSAQKFMNYYGALVGERIFILGSGDIGLIMARRMSLEGAEVVGVAEIMPQCSGLKRNQKQCLTDFNIPLFLSHNVVATTGTHRLETITIAQVNENFQPLSNTEKTFNVDTLLLAVGLKPIVKLYDNLGLQKNPLTKSVIVDSTYQSSMKDVYVIGNGLHIHDIVDYAALEGEIAAQNIIESVNSRINKNKQFEISASLDISYIVPQRINLNTDEKYLTLFFRVKNIMKNKYIKVLCKNRTIKIIKAENLLPAEMQKLRLKTKDINDNIEVVITDEG